MSSETLFRSFDHSELVTMNNASGEPRHIHHYFGSCVRLEPGPQGFLVEMPAHNTGRAHFHGVDQFQVFFGSPGAIYQKQPMETVVVHYSDGYAAYGPFSTADEGIEFFTLRARSDLVTAYIPEDMDQHVRLPGRRNVHAAVDVDGGVPAAGEHEVTELFTGKTDAMAAYWFKLGPSASVKPPSPEGSSGQYRVVVGGTVVDDDAEFPRRSVAWVGADAPPGLLTAGEQGAHVVVLQFPWPGTEGQPAAAAS